MDQWTDRSSDETTDTGSSEDAALPEESGGSPAAGSDDGTATPSDESSSGESPAFEPPASGDDNIREGRVGGLMVGPNQQQGQGQGG